ncbi:MAG: DUF624 domain-containing protein [Lachnospiraceae bacterium]|nr:DUF624 domain-containing protein [Lachnospiraceae bacterium]
MAENENNNLFDQDRLIWRIINRVWDVLLLSAIFTVTCIPVITIGASATGLYYTFLKMVRGEEAPALKSYWKSFRENFVQATILWLIMLLLGAALAGSVYFYYQQNTTPATVVMAFFAGLVLVWVLAVIYLFPLLSRFANKTSTMLFMSIFMPFKNVGWSILLLAMVLITVFLAWYVIPFIFFAYGVYAYCSCYIFVRVFKPAEDAIKKTLKQSEEEHDEV